MKRSPDLPRRLAAPLAALGLAVLLSACSAARPALGPDSTATPALQEHDTASAPDRGELMYRVLVAELAGHRGALPLSVENYLSVARATQDPEVAERALRIAVFARDDAAAREAARLWAALEPGNSEAHRVLAAFHVRSGDRAAAVRELERMVADWDGSRDKAYRVVVETLLRERDRDTAQAVMEAFMEARPEEREALLAHATFAIRAERLDEARGILARLLESDPDDAEALLLQTRVLRSQGRVEEALETLERLATLKPDDLDVRVTRARLLVGARRYDDALEAFRSLAEQAPRNADVRYALALLLLQTNRLDEAAEQLHTLVEQRQRRQVAHYYLGQIAEARGNPVEALAHYAEVEEGDHFVDAQVRTASLLAERGDLEAARAHLHGVAVDTTAEDVRLYLVESELLADAGRYEDAVEILGQGIAEHPESNDLLYARAMMAERLDRLELLEEDLRAILERDPDNAQALNALGYTLADRTERYEEAYTLIEKALELRPDDYYILDSMGWVLYRLGRLEEALEYLRRAAALSDDVEVAAHLGEVLWVMGERKEAREVWNSALEHTPGDPRLLDVMERLMP